MPRFTRSRTVRQKEHASERNWQSCTECRRRKLRCDRAEICGSCSIKGLESIYMPNKLEYNGQQEFERLEKGYRALEGEFARKFTRHNEGYRAKKDHA